MENDESVTIDSAPGCDKSWTTVWGAVKQRWCVQMPNHVPPLRTDVLAGTDNPSSKGLVAVRLGLGLTYLRDLLKAPVAYLGDKLNSSAESMVFSDSDRDLEKGAGPSEEGEVAKTAKDINCQALASSLPACATAYSVLKDAPNHVQLVISAGLLVMFILLYAGMLSRSLARRWLAFRLASCSAVTLLTFSFASQLSGPTYIALTAVVGVLLNLFIMLLRF